MDDLANARNVTHWRLVVRGPGVTVARLAFVAVDVLGTVLLTGAGPEVLAAEMAVCLVGIVIGVVGIVLIDRAGRSPRSKFLDLRWIVILDVARPLGPDRVAYAAHRTRRSMPWWRV